MALTPFQRRVCRLIARHRIESGESYVAGGAALSELLASPRLSRDIDLFHDTEPALETTWNQDRSLLLERGFTVRVVHERTGLVEAEISQGADTVLMEWARDSAFRFFPLVTNDDLGLTLHPFDLATNKVLALVGRLEVRDWLDVILCSERVQPLGYLAWAACGKDPGFSPPAILAHAARSSRYSADELTALAFEHEPPNAADLSKRWHRALDEAASIIEALPPAAVGSCVLTSEGNLFRGSIDDLREAVVAGTLRFHPGRLRGAYPHIPGA
jgi:hypothetical protein